MHVGFLSYYPLNLKDEYDGLRENANARWLAMVDLLKESGDKISLYKKKNHKNYDVLLFAEIPRLPQLFKIYLTNLIKKKIPIVVVLEETPAARSRFILNIPFLFDAVCVNSEQSNFKFRNYLTFVFSHASLPGIKEIKDSKEKILSGNRNKKLCFIASNKLSINRQSTYHHRYEIISKMIKNKMNIDLFGRGWDAVRLPMMLPLIAIIIRLPIIHSILLYLLRLYYKPINSLGPVYSQINTRLDYDFTLAFEPYIGKPIALTEKIFDPLLSGTIPIYYGVEGYCPIPSSLFIGISKDDTIYDIWSKINELDEEWLENIRNKIYEYLISPDADRYRYETFAHFISKTLYIVKNDYK